jgi:hypothetical protein
VSYLTQQLILSDKSQAIQIFQQFELLEVAGKSEMINFMLQTATVCFLYVSANCVLISNERRYHILQYESEVSVLKQQLEEAQQRLRMAEERLHDHESETSKIASEWQVRLEESEERMRKQQAEKDGQMKNIIQR